MQTADLLSHREWSDLTALRQTAVIREFKSLGEELRVAGPCPTVRMGPQAHPLLCLSCSPWVSVPTLSGSLPSLWVLLSPLPDLSAEPELGGTRFA